MQFLENEAYKAKLPTILQSKDRPHIIYSWAGGVLKAQIEAGVLEDITAPVEGLQRQRSPRRRSRPSRSDGKVYGLPHRAVAGRLPLQQGICSPRPASTATKIKTWDDLLAAVKKLKAAGVTPIAVGGADKWPLHFYWTHLAVRIGGKAGLRGGAARRERRLRGRDVPEVRRAVQAARRPAAVPERLPRLQEPAGGRLFRRRQGRDDARRSRTVYQPRSARSRPTRSGISDDKLGWFDFPTVPGGKGEPTDTLGGINGWLVTKGAPKEATEFLKFFISKDVQTRLAARQLPRPGRQGRGGRHSAAPSCSNIAQNLARRTITRTSTTRTSARRSAASSTT